MTRRARCGARFVLDGVRDKRVGGGHEVDHRRRKGEKVHAAHVLQNGVHQVNRGQALFSDRFRHDAIFYNFGHCVGVGHLGASEHRQFVDDWLWIENKTEPKAICE